MANENIIGRMKCPFCGEEHQDVKVNIRGNLYMICDNGCRFNFPAKATRTMKPLLMSGHNVNQNGILITSIKGGKDDTNRGIATNRNTTGGSDTIRRTDGQLAGNNAGNGNTTGKQQQQPRTSFFERLLNDDDDE